MGDIDRYARKITNRAVSQSLLAFGVNETYESVINGLSDVIEKYIETVGSLAHDISEHSGRPSSDISMIDILSALNQIPENVGGTNWKELKEFSFPSNKRGVDEAGDIGWKQPFRHSLPFFPVGPKDAGTDQAKTASVAKGAPKEKLVRKNLPAFVPDFPPEHSYSSTHKRLCDETEDSMFARRERLKRKRQAHDALQNISSDQSNVKIPVTRTFGSIDPHLNLPFNFNEKPPLKKPIIRGGSKVKQPLRLKATRLEKLKKEDLIIEGVYFESGEPDAAR
mmetsp:Transcript_3268/g.5066  ORF Transcript_3268/g.5066 Transcript_3268/m.5066 type:complete len:280 (-) Transcript_3268:77-916(-)